MEKVKVIIDGKEIEVDKNTTVLEAAKKLNILIPTFCYNEKLPIFGGCRICLVWDKKWKRSIIACGTYVYDGMEIETLNENVLNDRKFILKMLFTRHPLDCPVCDKAGECDLQNWGTYYGPQHNVLPISAYEKIRPEEDWESDYLEFVSNRCVLCLKCVSVCENINGADALFQEERGFEIAIVPDKKPMDIESSCEMCGLCVDICPVGAILFKPLKFNVRSWLLKERISYCGFCVMNCPVAIDYDEKNQRIYRIRSTADLQACSSAYLGYDCYESSRLKGSKINGENKSLNEVVEKLVQIINENPAETAYISSPYSTIETFETINKLVEKTDIKPSSVITTDLLPTIAGFKEQTQEDYELPTFKDILSAKKVVVIGEDVSALTPVISYFFKAKFKEGNKISDDKQVFYVGSNLKNLKKFFPKVLEKVEDAEPILDEETVVLYSPYTNKGSIAFQFGKKLGEFYKNTGSKVIILPYQTNAIGQLNNLKTTHYLPEIFELIEEGKIKNLIISGEDIFDYIDENYLETILSKLDSLIVLSPFENKLTNLANISIGTNLWLEESGTFEGFFGKRKNKAPLRENFSEKKIIESLINMCKYTPKAVRETDGNFSFYDFDRFINLNFEIYDFSYFSKYSKNLTNWKEKKQLAHAKNDTVK